MAVPSTERRLSAREGQPSSANPTFNWTLIPSRKLPRWACKSGRGIVFEAELEPARLDILGWWVTGIVDQGPSGY